MIKIIILVLTVAWGSSFIDLAEEFEILPDLSCIYFNQTLERLEEISGQCGLDQVEKLEDCMEKGAKFVLDRLVQVYVCFESEEFYRMFHLVSGFREEAKCILFHTIKEVESFVVMVEDFGEGTEGFVVSRKKANIFENVCSGKSVSIGNGISRYLQSTMTSTELKSLVIKWVKFFNSDRFIFAEDMLSKNLDEDEKDVNEFDKKEKYNIYEVLFCVFETSIDISPFFPAKFLSKDHIKFIKKYFLSTKYTREFSCGKYGDKLLEIFKKIWKRHSYDKIFNKLEWILQHIPDFRSFWQREEKGDTVESNENIGETDFKGKKQNYKYVKTAVNSASEGIKNLYNAGKEKISNIFTNKKKDL